MGRVIGPAPTLEVTDVVLTGSGSTIDPTHVQVDGFGTGVEPVQIEGDVTIPGIPTLTDAFGRLRTSHPGTVFGSKQTIDAAALIWDDVAASGAGTGTAWASARSRISVSASTAGKRVRQTFRSFDYQPGKAQSVMMTFVMGSTATGITRRVGQFDANNGLFLEQTPTATNFVIRKAGVDTKVEKASWSELPGGDGIDLTKAVILFIDYEWLGVGTVRWGFIIGGQYIVMHHSHHSNLVTGVYMDTPVLPLRGEIENDGTGGAATMDMICAMVASEGGVPNPGVRRCIDRAATGLTTNNDASLYPLISIRQQSTKLRSVVRIANLSVLCNSTALFRWALLLNPTVVGAALAWTALTNSPVEHDVVATNATTVTGGTVLASGYLDAGNSGSVAIEATPNDIELGSKYDGTADRIVLAVQRLTGTTETFYASLSWHESQ